MSTDFTPIPDYPGYSVNARGQVQGKTGLLLRHDAKGCVNVRQGTNVRKMYPGELLALAGWHRPDDSGQATAEAVQQADARIAELEAQLGQAQTEAEFIRARADGLEARLQEAIVQSVDAGKRKPKKPSPAPAAEDVQALQARCKAAEALAQKLEAQRDALAARLLAQKIRAAADRCTSGPGRTCSRKLSGERWGSVDEDFEELA